jgi:hypothetical protein
VRGIVTGTIEGEAGVDGMYTIGMWIVCWYAGGGVGAEMARRPTRCWNSGDGHHEREALAISLWLFSTTGLSFAIGSGLFTLDALRTVDIVGIHGFVLFL